MITLRIQKPQYIRHKPINLLPTPPQIPRERPHTQPLNRSHRLEPRIVPQHIAIPKRLQAFAGPPGGEREGVDTLLDVDEAGVGEELARVLAVGDGFVASGVLERRPPVVVGGVCGDGAVVAVQG